MSRSLRRLVPVIAVVVLAALPVWWLSTRRPIAPAAEQARAFPPDVPERTASSSTAPRVAGRVATAATKSADEPAGARANLVARIAAFDAWLGEVRPQARALAPADVVLGKQLARDRRAALKELIALDPREALAHRIPAGERRRLPAEITSQLEQLVDSYGDLEVISICDQRGGRIDRWTTVGSQRFATYTYGQRLETLSKNHLTIHGIAVDDVLAVSDRPYRRLAADEISQPPADPNQVPVAIGSSTRTFASAEALDAWTQDTLAAEQVPNPNALLAGAANAAALTAGWTTGVKRVLWIRSEFPDDPGSPATDDQINAAMAAANILYRDVSHDTCSLTTTILPGTVKLTTTKATYELDATSYLTLRSDAVQLARAYDTANGGTGLYNPDNYDRYVVIFKTVTAYNWAGIASVGAKGLSLNGNSTGSVTAHELGHNQGLRHSHGWVPTDGSAISSAGTHIEYGDAFDVMGSGQSGQYGGEFNTAQKFILGYLTTDSIQTVTKSGAYRIQRHDDRNASGIQALKIASSWAGTSYWFEYRHAAPYPQFLTPSAGTPEIARLQNGIEVHWDKGPPFTTGPGTYLLDMTPTTTSGVPSPAAGTTSSQVLNDAALALGESFNDPAVNLTVTPLRVGGTAPNEWIDVFISLGATTGNRAPAVTASGPVNPVPARTDVALSASGTDPDGDAVYYHWDFGDGTFAPANATITHQWAAGGTYTVNCTALDGRGGSSTASFKVVVDDPLLTWVQRAGSLTALSFNDVLFDGTKFVAVGPFVAATSGDGVNWTLGTGMSSHNYNNAVAYGGGRYVAVGSPSAVTTAAASISTSADGSSWTDATAPDGTPELLSVAYGAGRFVAVGDGGRILSSVDGATWTNVSTSNTNNLKVVRFGGGRFVAAGVATTFLTSTDGLNWQDVSVTGGTSNSYGLVYFQNAWLAVTSSYSVADPTKRVSWMSTDGLTWTKAYIGLDVSVNGPVPIANGTMILGVSRGSDGRILFAQATTGDWSSAVLHSTSGAVATLKAAAEGNGTIVVVGSGGQIYTPTGKPLIATQPASQTVYAGQGMTLTAAPYATGPFTYQWMRNGVTIAGATSATYTLATVKAADAGNYSVNVTNSAGSTASAVAQLVVNDAGATIDPSRLTNLSIRSQAGTGDQTLIVGVSVGGGGSGATKPLLVRAVGPTLANYGVSGTLASPLLSVYALGDTLALTSNDGWRGDSQIAAVSSAVGAFALGASAADAALYRPFDQKGYTMQVTGRTGTGVALVEIYDATPLGSFTAMTPRLRNVSARTQVGTGDNVLITGFAVGGSGTKRLLIRAVGPTLTTFGVSGTLADPKLELYRQNSDGTSTKVTENDNWFDAAAISTAGASVGAFALSSGSKDAALVVDLQPGSYSAIVRGVGDTTGVALVEVYDLR